MCLTDIIKTRKWVPWSEEQSETLIYTKNVIHLHIILAYNMLRAC